MHSSQYDEVYSQIVERTKELRLGSALSQPNDGFIPTVDVGAMANPARFADLERVVEQAAAHGATVDVGGTRWRHPYLENGAYFVPTVVGNVDPLSELAQRESTSQYLVSCFLIPEAICPTYSVRADCNDHPLRYPGPGSRNREWDAVRARRKCVRA